MFVSLKVSPNASWILPVSPFSQMIPRSVPPMWKPSVIPGPVTQPTSFEGRVVGVVTTAAAVTTLGCAEIEERDGLLDRSNSLRAAASSVHSAGVSAGASGVLTACGANPTAASRFDTKRGTTRSNVTAGPDCAAALRVTGSVVDTALSRIRGEATPWLTLSTTFRAAVTALSCIGAGSGAAAWNIDDTAGRVDGAVRVIVGWPLLGVVGDDEVLVST